MLTQLFFHDLTGVWVDRVWREGTTLHFAVAATWHAARCLLCRHRSTRIHSHYTRLLADLPLAEDGVVIHLQVRRFVCPAALSPPDLHRAPPGPGRAVRAS